MDKNIFDTEVAIIGAGPVGLFTIFECGMLKMKCHVIDALDAVGGQCIALYPEKPIYDIPAHPNLTGFELIENLKKQAAPFNPVYHLGQRVEVIERCEEKQKWRIKTSAHSTIYAKIIIIAAGVGAFGPNRPPLPHIEKFEDKSVFYFVKRKDDFKDKRIVIAGGGDSAVDWALSLADVAKKIMFVHRRPKFRAAPESVDKLHKLAKEGKIELVVPYQLEALEGDHGQLDTVIVQTLEGEKRRLEADCLLAFFGLSMSLGPIAHWGLNLDHHHIQVDPSTAQTNVKGIFAVGDVATYPRKLKLILTGFAEAAQAAHCAREIVYPGEVWHFEYSTTQGVPQAQKAKNG